MDASVQKAINEQINKELYAAYLYLAMSAHFDRKSLEGFSTWMRHQAREELVHAMRLFDHMSDVGGHVELAAVAAPPTDFGTPLSIFEAALEHERSVTQSIHSLYELARAKNEYPSQLVLTWFINEQVEEEKTSGTIVDQLRMIGNDAAALQMMDQRLGQRTAEEEEGGD